MGDFADLEVAPRFWELIAAARGDKATLRDLLNEIGRDDLIRFAVEFDYMTDDLVSQATDQVGDTYHEDEVAGWAISQGLRRFAGVYDGVEEFPAEVPDWDSNLKGMAVVVGRSDSGSLCPDTRSNGGLRSVVGISCSKARRTARMGSCTAMAPE